MADVTSAIASARVSPSPTITPRRPTGYATNPSACCSTIIFTFLVISTSTTRLYLGWTLAHSGSQRSLKRVGDLQWGNSDVTLYLPTTLDGVCLAQPVQDQTKDGSEAMAEA